MPTQHHRVLIQAHSFIAPVAACLYGNFPRVLWIDVSDGFSLFSPSHPLDVMDARQVLHHRPPLGRPAAADEHGLEGVPQDDDLAAQLRDVAVGHSQELVLVRHSLRGEQL